MKQRNKWESLGAGLLGAVIVWFRLFLGVFMVIFLPIFAIIGLHILPFTFLRNVSGYL